MIDSEVIIVGGGPAGSTCAWKLKQRGIASIVLDKKVFPRQKICAGWITPEVLRILEIKKEDYPHSLTTYNRLHFHLWGRKIPITTRRQYAIRRLEFDYWLLQRAGVPVYRQKVKHIRKESGYYVLDDAYRCKYLVGAGGTDCPVYRTFFMQCYPRLPQYLISTIESEFPFDVGDDRCFLWFFENKLPGYAWYVPKTGGYLNIGIGGKLLAMRGKGKTIRQHWYDFSQKLKRLNLIDYQEERLRGYNYYIRQQKDISRDGNAFIIGDAAGLATLDMGEGIGPAVQSAIMVARAISEGSNYSLQAIRKYSFQEIFFSHDEHEK